MRLSGDYRMRQLYFVTSLYAYPLKHQENVRDIYKLVKGVRYVRSSEVTLRIGSSLRNRRPRHRFQADENRSSRALNVGTRAVLGLT